MPPISLGEIAQALGLPLHGDANTRIARIAPLDSAGPGALSFLANPRYAAQLVATQASAVILAESQRAQAPAHCALLLAADPYHAFARLTQWWGARHARPLPAGIHRSAVVEEGAQVHPSAHVGAMAYVGAQAVVSAQAVLHAQAHVGEGAWVGEGTRIAAQAVLGAHCRIGARGIVHGGAVIGADGFGFAPHQGRYEKIAQLGAVRIGDDVEIGANTCIDRGALDDTLIADGVKLDNLVQIAHNVQIGAHTAFAGCAAVAGSTRIGAHCTIGGAANILGHLVLADHVHVSACTVISRSISRPGQYSGFFPFDDNAAWEKNAATLRHLHSLRDRIRALEKNQP